MPPKKTRRQLADEAYLRSQQLDITGALEPTPDVKEFPLTEQVPATCPECSRTMTMASGWTILRAGHQALQCGFCGWCIVIADAAVFNAFAETARQLADARARSLEDRHKKRTPSGKRTRGAG